MSFLQPLMLAALPLIGLPILIHLINQRRYQTVPWGAMMFLLAANRLSRGYARLRQWLIMAARMLAIAGLIFAVSRPLAGGWLGLAAGNRADTTMILLDRSASMSQTRPEDGGSKRESALRQLVGTFETLGPSRWILIDSGSNVLHELESIESLPRRTEVRPTSASAHIPTMLEAALESIQADNPGRAEVWIASDLRRNDWDPDSGRWQTLREAFLELPQPVRFHLLASPQTSPENLGIRVTEHRLQRSGDNLELLVSLRLTREGNSDERITVPVQFEIEGSRSEINVELAGSQAELKDHRIPLERDQKRGWGRVLIPADTNPSDNEFWFVFDDPPPRRTVLVAEDPNGMRPTRLAASIAPDPAWSASVQVVSAELLDSVAWEETALLLWQGPLPEGSNASLVRAFLDRGGAVLFFPPQSPDDAEFLGVHWTQWEDGTDEASVENWRGDADVLAHAQGGMPLPVGQLQIRRSCGLQGEFTPLATLRGGAPLLARVATDQGAAYFCATTTALRDSSLATDGVVLYVLIQRTLARGAEALQGARQLEAGAVPDDLASDWTQIVGDPDALSTEYSLHAGIYEFDDRLLAVNRGRDEDSAPVLDDSRVAELFRGLDFHRVDAEQGGRDTLIQEVWRLFLATMLVALVAESALCLPKPVSRSEDRS